MKVLAERYYYKGYYTLKQMRSWTKQGGENYSNWFGIEEFYEIVGITIETYDANVDFFKDMKYPQIQEYLANVNEFNAEKDTNE